MKPQSVHFDYKIYLPKDQLWQLPLEEKKEKRERYAWQSSNLSSEANDVHKRIDDMQSELDTLQREVDDMMFGDKTANRSSADAGMSEKQSGADERIEESVAKRAKFSLKCCETHRSSGKGVAVQAVGKSGMITEPNKRRPWR